MPVVQVARGQGPVKIFSSRRVLIPRRNPTVSRPSGGITTPFNLISPTRARQLGHVVLFLPLHPSVLEPDFDLALS